MFEKDKTYSKIAPDTVKRVFLEGVSVQEYPDRVEWVIPWRFSACSSNVDTPLKLVFRERKETAYKARYKYDAITVSDEGRVLEEWQKNHGDIAEWLPKIKAKLETQDMALVGGRCIVYAIDENFRSGIEHYLHILSMLSQPDLLAWTLWWGER